MKRLGRLFMHAIHTATMRSCGERVLCRRLRSKRKLETCCLKSRKSAPLSCIGLRRQDEPAAGTLHATGAPSQTLAHRSSHFAGSALSAEIWCTHTTIRKHGTNGVLNSLCSFRQAEMIEHHGGGENRS